MKENRIKAYKFAIEKGYTETAKDLMLKCPTLSEEIKETQKGKK